MLLIVDECLFQCLVKIIRGNNRLTKETIDFHTVSKDRGINGLLDAHLLLAFLTHCKKGSNSAAFWWV